MNEWVKVGTRFLNLSNVTEVRVHEQPRFARVFFVHGATFDLDEDDTDVLLTALNERVGAASETHRTVIAPAFVE